MFFQVNRHSSAFPIDIDFAEELQTCIRRQIGLTGWRYLALRESGIVGFLQLLGSYPTERPGISRFSIISFTMLSILLNICHHPTTGFSVIAF
jgi:hypothetical protein